VVEYPRFRYHPHACASNVFVARQDPCPSCRRSRGLGYVGPLYCIEPAKGLCPWCIASGEAARSLNATFVVERGPEPVTDPRRLDELVHRTPGYFFADTESPWPAHCDDYCAVVGRVVWTDVESMVEELAGDFARIRDRLGMSQEEIVEEMARGRESPLWADLFRCLHCGTHRLIADFE
jgi:uncharacterized protein CbrC (UPF0167 family)